jgi:ATP-binding cassette subfamily C protein CydD
MLFNKRLLNEARPAKTDLFLTVTLGLLGGIILVSQAFYLARIINRVFLQGDGLIDVAPYLWLLLGLSLLRAGLTWGGHVTAQRVAGQVKTTLRRRLTAHLMTLGPAYTRGQRTGELTNTVIEGVESLNAYFSQYLPQLALAALVPLTILVFVFPLDFTSGLVLLLTAPLIPVFMILIGNLADNLTKQQWTILSRMSAHFLDVLQGLTTLKILGRSREQAEIIRFISNRFGQTTMNVLRVAFLSALVLELVATLSTAVVAVEVGLRLLYGRLYFEQALFVLILAPEFYLPLRLLGTRFHAGMSGATAAKRIYEILETPPPRAANIQPERCKPPRPALIRFENVSYTYDDDRSAVSNISFDIQPGQKIALVGPSGAGKSTVAQLLLGFIQPTTGDITVNNISLHELPPSDWRAQLAWVPQLPYLFNTTVAANIALSRPDATPTEIEQAARLAHVDDFFCGLPQGYSTLIGERGARLSGGQAQRIALARAFLKNAPFLILDEATANLDPAAETKIQQAIEQLTRGRTALLIAHRLHTVRTADQILVMDRGQIVEQGTHTELLKQQGLYYRQFKV